MYSIPIISNANTYNWILPAGANGNSSTNNIIVNFGATSISGNITVNGVHHQSSSQLIMYPKLRQSQKVAMFYILMRRPEINGMILTGQ
jgi:hypothetical protein